MKITKFKALIAAIFTLTLSAHGCGGGAMDWIDASSGDDTITPSGTYAEFVDKGLVVHFETPISVDASVSKAISASNFSVTEDLTGAAVTINRVVPASDGLSVALYGAFKYMTSHNVAATGLVDANGAAIADLSLSAETSFNPRSLSGGRYGDLFVALGSFAAMFNGLDLVPDSEDSNEIAFLPLLYGSWMYTDPFSEEGCSLGSSSLNIPAYMQIGDGHSFLVGRVGTALTCGDIFAEGSAGISVDKGMVEVSRTTFLFFEDRDAGPVAEFMPAGDSIVMAFPVMSPPFDFNGDGIADFGFVETSTEDLEVDKAAPGLSFAGYEYLRIFFGRAAGGFAGRIEISEADVTIPVDGFAESKSVYDAWVLGLEMGANPPYYPAFAHGDLEGDGFDDIALAVYDTTLGRMVIKVWKGAAEAGVRLEPDSIVSAPGNQTYPEMVPNVLIADVNGDSMEDMIVGSTFEIAPYAGIEGGVWNLSNDWGKIGDLGGLPVVDPGMVQIILGRNPWPARLSTATANARIIEENARDELGRVTPLGMIASDYNNDGYADMLLAAPRAVYDSSAMVYRGKVYLFFGGADIGVDAAWEEMSAGDADVVFLSDITQDIMSGIVLYDPGDMLNDGNPDAFIAAGRASGAALYFHNLADDSAGVYGPADAKAIVNLSLGR
ncbi:MAG: hypothetical protein WC683_09175 [bacterium]